MDFINPVILPKNVQVPNQPPPNFTAITITIAATTFVVHPLFMIVHIFKNFAITSCHRWSPTFLNKIECSS